MGELIDRVDSLTMRILYYARPDYIFALLVDKNVEATAAEEMLERMYYLFIAKYRDHLGPNFDGEVSQFEDFADQIEVYIQHANRPLPAIPPHDTRATAVGDLGIIR